jgi:serine/threonine protein kinase
MNQRILNINTIVNIDKNTSESIQLENYKLENINKIINSNNTESSSRYKIVKYLGDGIKGKLYLAVDTNNNRFICKQITVDSIDKNNKEIIKQIEFELNILKYLSSNSQTREFINPCLEYKVHQNDIYTLFPVFNGYSLEHFIYYLSRMTAIDYYKISFALIKSILHAMAKIHNTHIAHQNINNNSILISTFMKPSEINVKITDFGLGCGYSSSPDSTMINIDEYSNDNFFKFSTCKDNQHVPIKINENIIQQLKDSDYLKMAQRYDLLCLGLLFIKILLYFDNLQINLYSGYNMNFIQNIKNIIIQKYLSKKNPKKLFPILAVPDNLKNELLEYLKIINEYIFCSTNQRKSCQYVLDKIIIYEKYKNDIFY